MSATDLSTLAGLFFASFVAGYLCGLLVVTYKKMVEKI